jgi:two-component system, NarL family, response regulator DegU
MAVRKKPGILIVDDDKQVLRSLKIWLKNEKFRPMTASNGEEAVEVIRHNPLDVALVDYKMDKENGIQVTQRLREVDPTLKIIILTGFPSYETAVEAMKVGIYDYISKGSSNEKILEVLRGAIEEREREKELNQDVIPTARRIRLLLFCNHYLLKERLENISKSNPKFQLVNAFPSMDSIGVKSISRQVDIAMVCASCNMKNLKEGYQILPELYRNFPEVKVLIINENFSDEEKVELLKLGVRGFCSLELSSEELEKALLRVNKGEIWVSRSVINLSLQRLASYQSPQALNNKERFGLTDREIEIIKIMALGLRNKEIANKLFISEKTVKTHINRVFKKLGVTGRANAILKAFEHQIL